MVRMRPLVGVATQGPCVASGGFYVLYDEIAERFDAQDEDDRLRLVLFHTPCHSTS